MGLGITQASIVSAVCDKTGDEGQDAVVKIRRLINEKGPDFCMLANWPFLRTDINFSITTAAYKYSGASYLPATFKKVTAAFLLDGTTRCPLKEVGILEAYSWDNPEDYSGRPDEYCITRMESGYWEIQFNRQPDTTYTIYMEIELQWSDLTTTTSETLITKEYFGAFSHFVAMTRAFQQGDVELYSQLKTDWYNPLQPREGIFGRILSSLSSPNRQNSVIVNIEKCGQLLPPIHNDYN